MFWWVQSFNLSKGKERDKVLAVRLHLLASILPYDIYRFHSLLKQEEIGLAVCHFKGKQEMGARLPAK